MDFIELDSPLKNEEPAGKAGEEVPQEDSRLPFEPAEKPRSSIFECLELDRSTSFHDQERWLVCPNCGYPNSRENKYCDGCQEELINFRQVELDEKKVKVVYKFSENRQYIFCPGCGAANDRNNQYCNDCMQKLK